MGTYTPNGQGIYKFHVDQATGALTQLKVFPSTTNPSWLALHPSRKFLYSGNEIANFNGTTTGSVSAYSVNAANGNHRGDSVTTFRLTGNGGKVTFTGTYTPVGSPAVIIFHRIG